MILKEIIDFRMKTFCFKNSLGTTILIKHESSEPIRVGLSYAIFTHYDVKLMCY